MGSSIGIAAITTVLAHREAIHRAVLVEHVTDNNPAATMRLQQLGAAFGRHTADPVLAKHQAMGVIDQIVNGQALLLSFADVFLYVAIAFVVTLPLLLLLNKGGNREAAAAAH
jgi:DHA2 family multidrug resistance protein